MMNLTTTHTNADMNLQDGLHVELYDIKSDSYTEGVYGMIRSYVVVGFSLKEAAAIVQKLAESEKAIKLEAQAKREAEKKVEEVEEKDQVIWKVRGTGKGKKMVIRYKNGDKVEKGVAGRDNIIKFYSIVRHKKNQWSCSCKSFQNNYRKAMANGTKPAPCKHMKKCFVENREGTLDLSVNLGEVVRMS